MLPSMQSTYARASANTSPALATVALPRTS
jgi:hypothetical protein